MQIKTEDAKPAKAKIQRDDIDGPDDQESYFEHMANLPTRESDSEPEFDEDGNIIEKLDVRNAFADAIIAIIRSYHQCALTLVVSLIIQDKDKAIMEALPRIDHATVSYPEINKVTIATLSEH